MMKGVLSIMKNVYKVLTIAGSDSSGGAGIQADLKTFSAHNIYGMSVITSVTAQNTMGVYGVYDVPVKGVAEQIKAVFEDIRPDAVKIGMVSNTEIINIISEYLLRYEADNIVLDPVMVSTSGSMLLNADSKDALISKLMPLATVITPNIFEAEILSGIRIVNDDDMVKAAKEIYEKTHISILVKGGHLENSANDLLYMKDVVKWFKAERLNNTNTHGTGCTLSSAIACNLAVGNDVETSVVSAKKYVYEAIGMGLDIGKGDGPLWHNVNSSFDKK